MFRLPTPVTASYFVFGSFSPKVMFVFSFIPQLESYLAAAMTLFKQMFSASAHFLIEMYTL